MAITKRAALYARVSTAEQEEGYFLDAQLRAMCELMRDMCGIYGIKWEKSWDNVG
jgi:DNA invertase Pin-like site-specific DNA recombinase